MASLSGIEYLRKQLREGRVQLSRLAITQRPRVAERKVLRARATALALCVR
jgi:hypothetical protein